MSNIINSTYEIIGKLGTGGAGIVYLANHLRLGKRVVLKADKRSVNTRTVLLRREVDVLKELNHTYIPQVYDYFIEGDTSYTVMDFVDGESLDKMLKREINFPQAQVIFWARQLLEALAYLHAPIHGSPPKGYVHSDVKPANIMIRPDGKICLIDFNISLAIGIETVIGKSDGYSSPEHYGIDYSFGEKNTHYRIEKTIITDDDKTEIADDDKTILSENETAQLLNVNAGTSSRYSSLAKKIIVPDARSDIYSVGATLYHLLSGKKPDKDAMKVEPLSKSEFSPLLVDIISKAMNPNPDLRFSTADEMIEAINSLWKNDPRAKRKKKQLVSAISVLSVIFVLGGAAVFTGMKQMELFQTAQVLAANSSEALSRGDVKSAVEYSLEALADDPGLFDIPYTANAQLALTNALGVYDLSDSFKAYGTIELPSAPFRILKSPDGKKLIACYAYELTIYDLETLKPLRTLSTAESALCGVKFLSDTKILYGGNNGLTAYDISSNTFLWQGESADVIALSEDKTVAAAINGTDEIINFYDTETGDIISYRELDGRRLNVSDNIKFADPGGYVLEMNSDGSRCAVSLSGGYLGVIDIYNSLNDLIIYDTSDNTVFEGVFTGDKFAFSAAGKSGSLFGMIDCETGQYLGDMAGNSPFGIAVYNGGLYVTQNDTAVMIDPETFEQTEIAYTENKNIKAFDISENYAVSATDNGYSVFFRGAGILQTDIREEAPEFVLITDKYMALADRNSPVVEILKLESRETSCIAKYDPRTKHSEARLISDRSGVMLFGINGFTVINPDGTVRAETEFTDPGSIYDQQFDHGEDCLDVTYYSGRVMRYSASTGELLSETEIAPPNDSLDEELETESFIVKSPLHGTPTVYDKETGREIAELNGEDYLTYITETDKYVVAQYISAEGMYYAVLMNKAFEAIAKMPYLCDITEDTLVYDLPSGNIKISPVYELDELKKMAENYRN